MSGETKKKRPAALNLANANPIPGTLQTPKDLAQDIAKHCLSPTVPRGISQEMLKRAQEIEHQQRQLILQRGLSAYEQRMEDEQEAKSQGSTPTSNLSVDSTSSAPATGAAGTAVDLAANPPSRVPRSVPGSATSLTYGRRPWELSNVPREAPQSAVPSLGGSSGKSENGELSSTLQERRGARPVRLDVKALKRDSEATPPARADDADPEAQAIGDDEDTALPGIHKLTAGAPVSPAKKRRFMQLCEEMWDLLHS